MTVRNVMSGRGALIGLLVVAVAVAAAAGLYAFRSDARVGEVNVDADNVAIHGYDTVAYFIDGKAMKGSAEHEHVWQDARWHFASASNRDLFAANPERYAPRYGGYCSMGLAMGEYSDVDPEMWTIVDGKLYLNKADWVQELWRDGQDAYLVASEANWKKHRGELRVNENLQ